MSFFRTFFHDHVSEKSVTFQDVTCQFLLCISGILGCFSGRAFQGGVNFETSNTEIWRIGTYFFCCCYSLIDHDTLEQYAPMKLFLRL